ALRRALRKPRKAQIDRRRTTIAVLAAWPLVPSRPLLAHPVGYGRKEISMKKSLFAALLLVLATGSPLLASGAPQPALQLQPALQAAPVTPVPALALPQVPAFLTAPAQAAPAAATPAVLPSGNGLLCPILPECDHYCVSHGCLVCCP